MTDHLTREQLLAYLDGELPRGGRRSAGKHLQACWACRTEVERLQDDIGLIVRAEEALAPALAAPPQPWPRLDARLDAATRSKRRPLPLYTAAAAAGIVLAVVLFWAVPGPLSAQEVMANVARAEVKRVPSSAQRYVRQRLRVARTARAGATTAASGALHAWRSSGQAYWDVRAADPVGEEIRSRYTAAGISAELPLSGAACERWTTRAGGADSAEQQDSVIRVSAGQGAASGLQVKLDVDAQDWHVTRMTLEFQDAGFEITEIDWTELARGEVPAEILSHLEPPRSAVMPGERIAVREAPPATTTGNARYNLADVEMEVRFALHRIGADLGEPVEVSGQTGDQVVVNAWSAAPARQAELRSLFGANLHVALRLKPPLGGAAASSAVVIRPPRVATAQNADDRLQRFFGSSTQQETFTRSSLQTSTAMLSHLFALQELAERVAPRTESQLSEAARSMLRTMIADHVRATEASCQELSLALEPLFREYALVDEPGVEAAIGTDWRTTASAALDQHRAADRLLRSMLTTTNEPLTAGAALPRLRSALAELQASLRALARIH